MSNPADRQTNQSRETPELRAEVLKTLVTKKYVISIIYCNANSTGSKL